MFIGEQTDEPSALFFGLEFAGTIQEKANVSQAVCSDRDRQQSQKINLCEKAQCCDSRSTSMARKFT
jgi:hypothetical protein